MTQQQAYRVLEIRGDVELRDYAPCVVADVVAIGSAEQAANAAFRPLYAYISGANRTMSSLSMTAPVVQQSSGEGLAMTAPVLHESAGPSQWTVSFVLPGSRSIEDYPAPTDLLVSLRALAGERAAALRWLGRWTSGNIDKHTEELRQMIAEAGWQVAGEARWARFDPPSKPPFARRTEIVMPIHGPRDSLTPGVLSKQVGHAGDRWLAAECGVWSVMVVDVEPAGQGRATG